MTSNEITSHLPYLDPFLFVDEITSVSENGTTGHYTFKKSAYFYKGHFKDHPVTPGVILTECMAQIGVVCLGIYLLDKEMGLSITKQDTKPQVALTSSQIDFYLPVYPEEKVTVTSEKVVFRFNKLICNVKLFNKEGKLVCRGKISGMLKN